MRVLFAEDDDLARRMLGRDARRRFAATVFLAGSAASAIGIFDRERPDVLVLDARLNPDDPADLSGLDVLRHARRNGHVGAAIMLSGLDSPAYRAAATAAKATACFHKSEFNISALDAYVEEAKLQSSDRRCELIGQSRAMKALREDIWKVARAQPLRTVLISGPTGSGKELIAKTLHAWSDRKEAPFFAINSAAMPSGVVESELFGHERGAFTGATQRRLGAFEAASDGVIFFDEIGDLPMEQQAKLLRVLDNKEFRPVGSNKLQPTNAWVIAATHVDLGQRVRDGNFREDLFYRLEVVTLVAPSLAERVDDIPELATTFGERASVDISFNADALRWLALRPWDGNVRQLRAFIERVATFTAASGSITPTDLESTAARPGLRKAAKLESKIDRAAAEFLALGGDLKENIQALERAVLERALREHGGNASAAAKALKMNRMTLTRRRSRT